jgi:cbb3-type cytochrome oxidase cytochrome c subunit
MSTYRPITEDQAREAFEKYYKTATFRRGAKKGQPRFTAFGAKRARGYDLNHSTDPSRIVTDSRYLRNPHKYDYPGVDVGTKVRKPLSPRQVENLRKGRATLEAKRLRATQMRLASSGQVGGAARAYKPITIDEAKAAFENYYATSTFTKGAKKGQPRFTAFGAKQARGYDLNHSTDPSRIVTDSRYLRNPHKYDYPGVDVGTKVRKPLSPRQVENLRKGRATLEAKRLRATQMRLASSGQVGGAARVYKPITEDQARDAFEKYYSTSTFTKGAKKGQRRFTAFGAKQARGYDLNHSTDPSRIVTDSRYLRNPHRYDYPGVDVGTKVRKPLSPRQVENLRKGRATLEAKRLRATQMRLASSGQVGGAWKWQNPLNMNWGLF